MKRNEVHTTTIESIFNFVFVLRLVSCVVYRYMVIYSEKKKKDDMQKKKKRTHPSKMLKDPLALSVTELKSLEAFLLNSVHIRR
jgi:hypothetical protein